MEETDNEKVGSEKEGRILSKEETVITKRLWFCSDQHLEDETTGTRKEKISPLSRSMSVPCECVASKIVIGTHVLENKFSIERAKTAIIFWNRISKVRKANKARMGRRFKDDGEILGGTSGRNKIRWRAAGRTSYLTQCVGWWRGTNPMEGEKGRKEMDSSATLR